MAALFELELLNLTFSIEVIYRMRFTEALRRIALCNTLIIRAYGRNCRNGQK